jgi:hypothetical protein
LYYIIFGPVVSSVIQVIHVHVVHCLYISEMAGGWQEKLCNQHLAIYNYNWMISNLYAILFREYVEDM